MHKDMRLDHAHPSAAFFVNPSWAKSPQCIVRGIQPTNPLPLTAIRLISRKLSPKVYF